MKYLINKLRKNHVRRDALNALALLEISKPKKLWEFYIKAISTPLMLCFLIPGRPFLSGSETIAQRMSAKMFNRIRSEILTPRLSGWTRESNWL